MEALTPLAALILGVVEGLTEFLPISSTGHLIVAANLLVAFIPLAVLGLLFGSAIKASLFKPVPVAMAFIVGGLIILWAERRKHVMRIQNVEDMRWTDALKVGIAQTFALIPGTSRAGSTIIGGLFFGLSRKAATE